MTAAPFAHLEEMTDDRGLFEHADGTRRRVEHGYCTDDNARMLVVTSREADTGPVSRLGRIALAFTLAAQDPDGTVRNRMDASGRWNDRPATDDCWGRSLWGLGVAAALHDERAVRDSALAAFDRGCRQRSIWPRAMAFAALGAAEVLSADPRHAAAAALLRDAAVTIGPPAAAPWTWPEPRLTYANAALAEATIAAGATLGDGALVDRGLAMLGWLLAQETSRGHLSVVAVGGRGQFDEGRRFDQQPIEVAAMSDACWRAFVLTGGVKWSRGVEVAAAWFDGENDTGAVMRDPSSGGGFDGLQRVGVNRNQGAESTLALISTMQRARAMQAAA
jgi:hypothetical protein